MEHSNRPSFSMWVKTRQWFKLFFYQDRDRVEGWWAGKARSKRAVKDMEFMKNQCCIDHGSKLVNIWRERCHKKIDANMVPLGMQSVQDDLRYWEGFNKGLEWAHRIVDGDKSAD